MDPTVATLDPKVGHTVTNTPAISNAKLLIDGNGDFNNFHLFGLMALVPYVLTRLLWIPYFSFTTKYIFLLILSGAPTAVAYWMVMSRFGRSKSDKGKLPGLPIEHYIDILDPELREQYNSKTGKKIPMQVFHDAYFEGKIKANGDLLDVLEWRNDWACFPMTLEHMKYVFQNLIPEVLVHSKAQDRDQIRENYDRGDDFYNWFLGPRMIYTSGIITDLTRKETIEELQDNKLAVICQKLELKPTDTLLDIGCGWGTLVAYANRNYECDATGVTLAVTQETFGNKRIAENGCDTSRARILCKDYREIGEKKFSKIVSLEMAEHVGILKYRAFMRQVYDLLEDDGIFVYQVSGFRVEWQFEDLNWGLFMNKYVFPGADASCALSWHLNHIEAAGFEVKSIDVMGVHYSATLHRWYENWLKNKDLVVNKYGIKWFRTWEYFLASSTIISRNGGASLFQMVLHKNKNAYHRVLGVPNHVGLQPNPPKTPILIQ